MKYKYQFSNHKSSDAALRLVLEHNPAGFDQLIGICYIACRGLHFPDAWATYRADGLTMVGQEERLRDFIVTWLTNELAKYQNISADRIQEAEPKLRHLPKRCRQAVLSGIRKCPACGQRKTKQCLLCDYTLSHRDVNTGVKNCPNCAALVKEHFQVACRNGCHTPSVRTSLDNCYSDEENGSNLSEFVVAGQQAPREEDVFAWLSLDRPELDKAHPDLCLFITTVYEHFANGGSRQGITRTFAAKKNLSLKAARRLRVEIQATIAEHFSGPLLVSLYRFLDVPRASHASVAVPMTRRAKAAIGARREASQLLRENYKQLGIKTPSPTEPEMTCFIDDGSRGLATYWVENHAMREVAAEEMVTQLIADTSEEEVRAYFNLREDDPLPGAEIEGRDSYCGGDITYDEETGYDASE